MNNLNKISTETPRAQPANSRKIRVLILIKGLGLGGAENLLVSSLPYLDFEKYEYEVGYLLPWKNALEAEIEKSGIRVTCYQAKRTFDLHSCRRVFKHIQQGAFDIIHSHLPVTGIIGRLAAKWYGLQGSVYTEHGSWNRLHWLTRFVNRVTLSMNDVTIAVSDDVAQSISVSRDHPVVMIPNGINCNSLVHQPANSASVREELNIPPDDFVIGNVANLSPVKNHETLIKAFAIFHQSYPQSTLVLVGQFRNRLNLLQKLAEQLDIKHKTIFTGPRTDVPRIVGVFDLFAMSSVSEGLPVSLLEAMALSRPVVCTAVGGIPSVVTDGIQGFLVPVAKYEMMSERFSQLINDQELRIKMGAAGRDLICQKYDIAQMVSLVEQQYHSLIEINQHASPT